VGQRTCAAGISKAVDGRKKGWANRVEWGDLEKGPCKLAIAGEARHFNMFLFRGTGE